MSSKSLHIGHSEQHPPRKRAQHTPQQYLVWSTQILLIVVMLVIVGIAYGVLHLFRTGAAPRLPDNMTLPLPSPGP
jgi:hypothetical protein